ncbi:MAG: biotin--[Saccharopolyspora sp.]|uniref:biotin--[acetyl-CoA-carboxylase] ligase n=1 Tax=Saccharopolyspora sp. TaxID=33915 RepID=UPI0025DD9CE0|nr:biotin--[acetyl-CoA-carboxylase] ligase [Saccharopolyspora sp.]MBQ6639454.1 biotin--[acetyl-CoA-carboxylase] ligase [Saccharopolyspora sp.]
MEPVLLDADNLRKRLVEDGPYSALDVVTVTGSTNTDLVQAAGRGAADRTVLFAEEQQAGRGRLSRGWVSPRGQGLHVSVLLRPSTVPREAIAWLPLIGGVALAETVQAMFGLTATLKWPNDLLLGDADRWQKAAGILAEGVAAPDGMAIVLGMGINVHQQAADLPHGAGGLPATSLAAQGAEVDREEFAVALLRAFADADRQWRERDGDVLASGLLDRYQRLCGTLGQRIRVELGTEDLRGVATDVDPSGRLVVRGVDGASTPVSAGDVVHLRPN